jgi:hypothetical protein
MKPQENENSAVGHTNDSKKEEITIISLDEQDSSDDEDFVIDEGEGKRI